MIVLYFPYCLVSYLLTSWLIIFKWGFRICGLHFSPPWSYLQGSCNSIQQHTSLPSFLVFVLFLTCFLSTCAINSLIHCYFCVKLFSLEEIQHQRRIIYLYMYSSHF